jgi:hypothetical protein
MTGFFSIRFLIPGWYLMASPLFSQFPLLTVETAKKGGCPEDHLGIKNRIKKIPVN